MVQFYPSIPDHLRTWALSQPLFYVASAPLTGAHINLSPKGLPAATFTIFDGNTAAYIDATGSGVETISHVYENGRVTVMFASFEASPRIMRLFCWGRVVECDSWEYGGLLQKMGKEKVEGARAVVVLRVWKAQTTCGFGVPLIKDGSTLGVVGGDAKKEIFGFEDRPTLASVTKKFLERKELDAYQEKHNVKSLDGLNGFRAARRRTRQWMFVEDVKVWLATIMAQRAALAMGAFLAVVVMLLVRMVLLNFGY